MCGLDLMIRWVQINDRLGESGDDYIKDDGVAPTRSGQIHQTVRKAGISDQGDGKMGRDETSCSFPLTYVRNYIWLLLPGLGSPARDCS